MSKTKNFLILFSLLLFSSCVNNDLQNALDADKNGDTNSAIKHFDKYLDSKHHGKLIDTNNQKINSLQAKRLVQKIEATLENDEDTLRAQDLRKLLKKMDNHSDWDKDDIIFSLTKSKIQERLDVIRNECESLENVLNIFLENREYIKAYKTFNFIKEKDASYDVSPLTEIKIVDIFVNNNEPNFLRNLEKNNFDKAALFLQSIDEQFFKENYKKELKSKYLKILKRKVKPQIENLIENKKYLNAYYINANTINDEKFTNKIRTNLKNDLISEDGVIKIKDFLTLEGYLIISPELKELVEKDYYEKIDKITLPTTNISFILKNHKLKNDIYSELKSAIKEEIVQMSIPVKIKNSKAANLDYQIELDTYKIANDEFNTKLNITKLRPKYENIIVQNIYSSYNEEFGKISIEKLTRKIMKVIRKNVTLDAPTMLKSARYYLAKKDFSNFKDLTEKLILLNQVSPFCDELKIKLINLLSEYEAL